MAQIKSNWTAPTFSFDEADQPHAWEIFYLTSQDYLEVLRIKPQEEDQQKRGWEQITQMFTGENRQILQNLIDNNTITETDQRTPILALKAIETAIKNKEHHRNPTTTTTRTNPATTTKSNNTKKSRTKCPWKQFHKRIIEYMDSLHAEQCEPQMKIDTFVNAIRNTFFQQNEKSTKQTQTTEQPMMTVDARTTMDLEQTSTKQTQTIEQPKMEQKPSNNTKKTANSETDDTVSAYNTDTEHLPRPPCNKNQPKPGTSTWSNTQTTVKQPTRTPAASTYLQHTRKTPLLPTPPSPVRNFNYSSHYKQYITRPSAFNNRNPAFTRPSPFYNRLHQQPIITRPSPIYNNFHHQPLLLHPTFSGPANDSYYLQSHLPGPHTAFPPYLHQNLITAPYQQTSGHFPQWVYYVPIILPHYTI